MEIFQVEISAIHVLESGVGSNFFHCVTRRQKTADTVLMLCSRNAQTTYTLNKHDSHPNRSHNQ